MWSWLERILRSLQAETEEENDNHPPRVSSSSKQPQTRTKSIYPRERERTRTKSDQDEEIRGQFRFPVIPDRSKQQSRRKEVTDVESPFEVYKQSNALGRTEDVSKQAIKKQETPANRPVPSKSPDKDSAAFQPTQILSPIYGKIDPNKTVPTDHQLLHQAKEEKRIAEKERVDQEIQMEQIVLDEQVNQDSLVIYEEHVPQEVLNTQQVTVQHELEPMAQEYKTEIRFEEILTVEESVESEMNKVGFAERTVLSTENTEVVALQPIRIETKPVEEDCPEIINTEDVLAENTPVVEVVTEISPIIEVNSEFMPIEEKAEEIQCLPNNQTEDTSTEVLNEYSRNEVFSSMQQVAPTIEMEQVEASPQPLEAVAVPVAAYQPHDVAAVQVTTPEFGDHSYEFPSLSLLDPPPILSDDSYEYTLHQKQLLEETLENFHVNAQVVGIVKGPAVTRFELQPAPGVKVNKITGLSDDIKLNLAAKDIRIEAPIPGRNAVGIEVPNLKSEAIYLRRIIGSERFQNHPSPLAIALGMDIGGEPIVADIKKMPHGLIAGSTGSGKSVCINSIIVSLLYKATPEQVRLLLIDPKMVELAPYNHLPHLVTPVVTDAKQATASLKWAVEEMEKRYALFVDAGVRDIDRYNKQADLELPYIVIIIDELADLMMVSPQDVEDCIIRIAQKARACGIHLLLATQRPSVDVITGNIKANVPTRLAFAVFSQIDSRTILDQSGAERLLGRGDMLFLESGTTPIRLQGNYVSDDEIDRVTEVIKNQRKPAYLFSKEDLEQSVNSYDMGDDSLFHEALVFVAEQGQASASSLQRRFRIGYNRAARLIDMMEAEGFIAGQSGGKPRAVLITVEDAQAMADGTSLL